jgi:glycosyltransferase involved in cell wall biosynthesis
MANRAVESELFSDEDIYVIPNGLDTGSFRPRPMGDLRDSLGVSAETKVICFGAGYEASFKGMDLMYDAIEKSNDNRGDLQFVKFGSDTTNHDNDMNNVADIGFLEGESLKSLYSDANAIVLPSRIESFGQIASEALASGTPVVAFDATGPRDIVDHKETGYLADPFNTSDLAKGIRWVVENPRRNKRLGEQARDVAERRFAIGRVAEQYYDVYRTTVET